MSRTSMGGHLINRAVMSVEYSTRYGYKIMTVWIGAKCYEVEKLDNDYYNLTGDGIEKGIRCTGWADALRLLEKGI